VKDGQIIASAFKEDEHPFADAVDTTEVEADQ
jgi:hypothetical protein